MRRNILLVGILLFGVILISGCISASTTYQQPSKIETPSGATTSPKWNTIMNFSGINSKVTDSFYIAGKKWRFTWECVEDTTYGSGFGGINIAAYPEGEKTLYSAFVMMGKCTGPDTTYVYEGPGNYYFDVMVANVKSWDIKVESWH